MNGSPGGVVLPRRLLDEVARTLRPVRPLPPPWRRAWPLAVAGAALLVGVPARYGVRHDLAALGPWLSWGLSGVQLAVGLVLVAAALREAVPARQLSPRSLTLLLGGAVAAFLTVTGWTAFASGTLVPAGLEAHYWRVCYRMPVGLGVPVLLVAWVLAARAWPVRPVLTGALCGLGTGLLVDAGWRLFCEVADPRHVLEAHGLAALSLGLLGALAGAAWGRWVQAR